jgi:hypothetical protein
MNWDVKIFTCDDNGVGDVYSLYYSDEGDMAMDVMELLLHLNKTVLPEILSQRLQYVTQIEIRENSP